jgi:hypothetical protein
MEHVSNMTLDGVRRSTETCESAPASTCQALSCPARFCLCQFSIPRVHSRLAGDPVPYAAAVADEMSAALQRSELHLSDVMMLRVYYCPSVVSQEAAERVLRAALHSCIALHGTQPAAAWVPVTAVGCTPAVDAAVHIVMTALRV